MPAIAAQDAESIMKALLAMRGYDKKKHLEAYSQDVLKVPLGDLKLQGTLQKWRTTLGHSAVWNTSFNPIGNTMLGKTNLTPDGNLYQPGVPVNPGHNSDEDQDDKIGAPVSPDLQLVSIPKDARGGIDHPPLTSHPASRRQLQQRSGEG